ncbi:hypothetical protein [Moorena sp. SIO4A5]|uniref:hypothetical protein n=1 Tax=Moorena sp. SIO4A5 TaxID=2607838 RepID=UPI0013C68B68|nr:hypothetical protein [Moorena sp. SIO4A5]NEO24001.1 hypothetical protein [Moorena sp. SIO4A5]
MRYTGFFTSCLLPLLYSLLPAPCSLLPAPCSLLPAPCSLTPRSLYLMTMISAIYKYINKGLGCY